MTSPTWPTTLDDWRSWLTAAGRPRTTIGLRCYQLRRFADDHPDPWSVGTDQIIGWLASFDWSPESRRSYRSALRSFYGWAHATGRVEVDPTRLLPPISPSAPRPRPTPPPLIQDALGLADDRVRLMILLAARQGLRRGEIARIHSEDLMADLTGWSLLVHGKGNKQRLIPLHADVAALLRLLPPGWAFPGRDGGHLSPRWVGTLVRRLLPGPWTTHTLRHSFASRAYAGSRDLLAVSALLGHARAETTQRYVQLPDDAMRAALRHAA